MESWSVGFDGDSDVERHAGVEAAEPARAVPLRLRVISDYIWPWCFIGLVRVERLRREFDVELDVYAYDLRPGIPPEGLPRDEVYRGSRFPPGYLDRLRQMAKDSGIEMIAPPVVANTRKAHEATEFARDGGRLPDFHRAVFAAYWEKGENIGDEDVLHHLATDCGLDGDALRPALADGRYKQRVEDQMAWAREAGLSGVPSFVFNEKFVLVGAQDYDVFADITRRMLRKQTQAEG